ncbi:MAG TPA: DUF4040 domain-containing protein [Candidatus Ratteibacteria bacterium]|nr:DUF4040 domain-containing protein [bacterium]HRS05741.1 DUF4040 domain-containing protein [Candidatus Ratteibacteria bacterium]HON04811.1 DUF4040 domain-containing protein [bacterium]HPC29795.1 DUF4040 domain-containing protein [bacterium]HQL65154.1 DUF4040 domain-containing protein [bacterium]
MTEVLVEFFLVFMVIGAIIALETKDLLSSVISVGAVGVAASICFLLLGAPDIASTQLVVEVLTVIILIKATIRHDLVTIDGDREFFGLTVTLAFLFVFSLFGLRAFWSLPEFGTPGIERISAAPSNNYISSGFKQTGSSNILTAILLDYRGLDTFAELCALFAGIWGALAIMRVRSRKKKTGNHDEKK